MYLYSMRELENIKNQKEVLYIDQQTGLQTSGIVVGYDDSEPGVVFIYIASIYDEENNKIDENGIRYKDIFVFDDKPNMMKQFPEDQCGIYRDAILGQFGKESGRDLKL